MGTAPPFMYSAERLESRFPDVPFDPKAITRASWEPKPNKAQPRGPLVSFNRHPDSHSIFPPLSTQRLPLGPRAKNWIKRLRRLQLGLRVLQLNGALGTLTLMILIINMEAVTAWALKVGPAISIAHTLYATYHLSRSAVSRTPASSAAYHFFAFVTDLGIVGLYAFGAFSVHQKAGSWTTRLTNKRLMHGFVPAAYYVLVATGALHLLSLAFSLWLGLMFRNISFMPPDMNPLEDHLTARPCHKRNKSSIATTSTVGDDSRFSTSLEPKRSTSSRDDVSRPPGIPFMHTREGSSHSASGKSWRPKAPDSLHRAVPGFATRATPRPAGPTTAVRPPCAAQFGSYTGLPAEDPGQWAPPDANHIRIAKFTETWLPTDSLISRTNHRTRNTMVEIDMGQVRVSQTYSAVPQDYNLHDSSESEEHGEWEAITELSVGKLHPNPLRSHPALRPQGVPTAGKAYLTDSQCAMELSGRDPLTDISGNQRQASLSRDIADQLRARSASWKLYRRSSVQAKDDFCWEPPTGLIYAAPPLRMGPSRKISSGNDYRSGYPYKTYGRRNISGKQVEEGQADTRVPLLI